MLKRDINIWKCPDLFVYLHPETQIQLHMYRISIKRNNVKRVSEDPVKVISLPSKWEKWEDVSEPGEYAYELTRMLEKCEIRAYKIEDLHYLKPQKED